MGDDLNPDNFRTAVSLINAGAVVFDTRSELEVARTGNYPGAYNIYYPNFESLRNNIFCRNILGGNNILIYKFDEMCLNHFERKQFFHI